MKNGIELALARAAYMLGNDRYAIDSLTRLLRYEPFHREALGLWQMIAFRN